MRLWNWKSRLAAFLTASAAQPYAIGHHDCALFAAGAVMAVTGHDPGDAFRGRYRSKTGGLRLVRAAGHTDHIAVFAAALEEIAPSFAAPGDVAVVMHPQDGPLLGVVQGESIYVLGENGLGHASRALMVRAFRT